MRGLLLLLALLLLAPQAARAGEPARPRELVLLFTGDVGGEVAPCG